MVSSGKFTINLDQVGSEDQHYLGQAASFLASLKSSNFLTPDGFVITPAAYFEFLAQNKIETKLNHLINSIDFENDKSIENASKSLKKILKSAKIPRNVVKQIVLEYESLKAPMVRISASIISGNMGQNDLPLEVFEDEILGEATLMSDVRQSWAELFNPSLLAFRNENNIDQTKSGMSLSVQKILSGGLSGKLTTVDSQNRDRSKIVIEVDGRHGLTIDRTSGKASKRVNESIPQVFLNGEDVNKDTLPKDTIQKLVDLAIAMQIKHLFPQEIRWVINNDQIYVLEVREISLYGKN